MQPPIQGEEPASQEKKTPPLEPLLVRVEEAARLLSLSRSAVYELLDRGELPSVRYGAARRIPLAGLREWISRQLDGNQPPRRGE
jgi:excisionase family DNA binding protein